MIPRPSGAPPGMAPETFASMDENTVLPEEQAHYDQFTTKALHVLYSPKSREAILRQLNRGDLPAHEALGRTAAQIALGVQQQAKASGVDISPDIAFHVTADSILPALLELGQAARILPTKNDQQQLDLAFGTSQAIMARQLLQGKNAGSVVEEAQNVLAQRVAGEVDSGAVDSGQLQQRLGGAVPAAAGPSRELATPQAVAGRG